MPHGEMQCTQPSVPSGTSDGENNTNTKDALAAVLDEDMIRECVQVSVPIGREARRDIDIYQATSLVFSFRGLARIDNLVGFSQLTKLQLDNNRLRKVEHLDELVTLEWLDLSFNFITKIEGLEKLVELTDLSLFNNQLTKLENMDTLTNLQVLSLGNNKLEGLEQAMYLRRLKKLHVLNLSGNPLAEEADYTAYLLAFIKGLKYLDYRRVSEAAMAAAREQFHDEILELEGQEAEELVRRKEEGEREGNIKHLQAANCAVDNLLEDMFENDPEASKLKVFDFWVEPREEYQQKFASLTEEFKRQMVEHYNAKQEEEAKFRRAMEEAKTKSDEKSVAFIQQFQTQKRTIKRDFYHTDASTHDSTTRVAKQIDEMRNMLQTIEDELMGLELNQGDAFEEILRKFETLYRELVNVVLETVQNYFGRLRDLETSYSDACTVSAQETYEEYLHSMAEDRDQFHREAVVILQDKDRLLSIVSNSRDAHITKIYQVEDEIVTHENSRLEHMMSTLSADEDMRHSDRVMEIWNFVDCARRELTDIRDAFVDEAEIAKGGIDV